MHTQLPCDVHPNSQAQVAAHNKGLLRQRQKVGTATKACCRQKRVAAVRTGAQQAAQTTLQAKWSRCSVADSKSAERFRVNLGYAASVAMHYLKAIMSKYRTDSWCAVHKFVSVMWRTTCPEQLEEGESCR